MQLLQRTNLQAPATTHSNSRRLLVRCTALRGEHCVGTKQQAKTVIRGPGTVPPAKHHAHNHLVQSSHVKQLQRCTARRWNAEEPPANTGSVLERQITGNIKDSQRLQDLENVLNEWGSSFNYIHASAAFVKAARLAQNRPATAASVCSKLVHIWHQLYSGSDEQGLANVLWASSKLQVNDPKLWREALEAFTPHAEHAAFQALSNVVYALAHQASRSKGLVPGLSKEEVQHAVAGILKHMYVRVTHPVLEGVSALNIANTLWGIGKLGYAADTTTLSALLRALVRPRITELADPQMWSNSIYGLSKLVDVCDLQAVMSPPICARLLSESAMKKVANSDSQNVANTLLALGRLSNRQQPPISLALEHQCAVHLLQGKVAADLAAWKSQEIANSLWASAVLQITQKPFLDAVVHAKKQWLPKATSAELKQVAWAFSKMDFHDPEFMQMVVECSQQHLNRSHSGTRGDLVVGLAVVVSCSIARSDMQELATEAVALIKSPAVMLQMQKRLGNLDASMLWQVHTWLLEHALLDGQGLSSCLTSEQLGVGKGRMGSIAQVVVTVVVVDKLPLDGASMMQVVTCYMWGKFFDTCEPYFERLHQ